MATSSGMVVCAKAVELRAREDVGMSSIEEHSKPSAAAVPKHEWVLGAAVLISICYAIYSRTGRDFAILSALAATPIALLIYGALAISFWRGKRPRKTFGGILFAVTGPLVMAALVGVVYFALAVTIRDALEWLQSRTWPPLTRGAVGAVCAAGAGALLFWFRLQYRFVYGLSEVLVGIGVAGYHAYRAADSVSMWDANVYLAILTAGIYLVVRGADNMHTGLTKAPVDPLAFRIFRPRSTPCNQPEGEEPRLGFAEIFFLLPLSKPKPGTSS